jgi:mevalonate pyrophosphate decarboxylase
MEVLIKLGLQKKLGVILKDASTGPFIDEWKKVYAEISDKVEEVDIAPALSSAALAVKDENEPVSERNVFTRCMLNSPACNAKCLQSVHRSYEPILCRRDVECTG